MHQLIQDHDPITLEEQYAAATFLRAAGLRKGDTRLTQAVFALGFSDLVLLLSLFRREAPEIAPADRITIELNGRIPGKKNRWRRGKLPADIAGQIEALKWQIREQWKHRPPLRHAALTFELQSNTLNKDRDNMVGTLLDALQSCGVLTSDNINHQNGRMVILPATVSHGRQLSRIHIDPAPAVDYSPPPPG